MNISRSFAAAALAGLTIAATAPASAIVVGGVDFGSPGTSHLETTTLAETLVTANGQNLMGYGQVNTVNGNLFYAGAQRLYFTFTGYTTANFAPGSVDFTGGVINVYLGNTFNLLSQSSVDNLADIQAMTPWATLSGHTDFSGFTLRSSGLVTGAVINFTGAGLLTVTGGQADVVNYLNANNIADGLGGFADISLSTSGNNNVLNQFDDTTGCRDGSAVAGQWCIAGSADLRGSTVIPEPASLALVGLALAGLGFGSRARSRKVAA